VLVQIRVQWPPELKGRTSIVLLPGEEFVRVLSQDGTDTRSSRFTFLIPDWKPSVAGLDASLLELGDRTDSYIAPEQLRAGVISSLQFIEDLKTRKVDGLSWPSTDWNLKKLQIAMQISEEATESALVILRRKEGERLFAFGPTLDVSGWTQAWDQTTPPPTVVMSPDGPGRDAIVELLGKVTSTTQYLVSRKLPPVP